MASDEKIQNLCNLLKEKAQVEAVPTFDENGNIIDMEPLTPAWLMNTTCFRRSGKDIPAEERKTVWDTFNSGDSMNSIDFCLRLYNSFAKSYEVLEWEPMTKADWDSTCKRKGRISYKLTDDEVASIVAYVVKVVEPSWSGNIPAVYTVMCDCINTKYAEKVEKNSPKETAEDTAEEKATYRSVFNKFKARIGELVEKDEVLQALMMSISVEEQEKILSHFKVAEPKKKKKEKAEKPAFVPIKPTELMRLTEVMTKESANMVTQVLAQISMTPAGSAFNMEPFEKVHKLLLAEKMKTAEGQ